MKQVRKKNNYWFKIQDYAISAYNKTDDIVLRNRIYKRFINGPFNELVDILCHKYKVWSMGGLSLADFKYECLVHIITKLGDYDSTRGKSYSFFTVILRNYIWQIGKKNYASAKRTIDVEDLSAIPESESPFYVEDMHLQVVDNIPVEFVEWALKSVKYWFPNDEQSRTVCRISLEHMHSLMLQNIAIKRKEFLENINELISEEGMLPRSKTAYLKISNLLASKYQQYQDML